MLIQYKYAKMKIMVINMQGADEKLIINKLGANDSNDLLHNSAILSCQPWYVRMWLLTDCYAQ